MKYSKMDSAEITKFAMDFLINPLPEDKILDWPKLKEIAYNILKCI